MPRRVRGAGLHVAVRSGSGVTLAYLDVDHFKQLNDSGGHAAGDALLPTLGAALSDRLRRSDVAGRLGGDEFALLLPDAAGTAAAEAVLMELHARLSKVVSDPQRDLGISIGAITFRQPPQSLEQLLAAADEVMYEVKTGGRNGILLRCVEAEAPPRHR